MTQNNLGLSADLTDVIAKLNELQNKLGDLTKQSDNLASKSSSRAKRAKTDAEKLIDVEKKLASIQTEEGRRLIQKKAELNAVTAAIRKKHLATLDLDDASKRHNKTMSASTAIMRQFRGMMLQTFGAYAVLNGIKKTFDTIKDFELQMARVRAITGATKEEFEILSAAAKSISLKGSIFDPKTIAELQVELAKLGFSAKEISLTTEPIVNLATAMQEDLAKSAEIAAATLRSFNLDASLMGQVIDVMGKSFATTALDMSRWAEAAKYAAPVANNVNWSVKDLAATMGVLANRQIFGSLAGTSLRNIFAGIADKSSDLSKAMGGNIETFDDFVDGLERMNKEGYGFNEILKVTEKRTSTALLLLVKNSEELRKARLEYENVNGAIKEMADIQLNTLSANIEKAGAAWKAFILSLDEGDGVISKLIKGSLGTFSDVIKSLAAANQYGASAFMWWVDAEQRAASTTEFLKQQTDEYLKSVKDLSGEEKSIAQNNEFERRIRLKIKETKGLTDAQNELKDITDEINRLEGIGKDKELTATSFAFLNRLKDEQKELEKSIFLNKESISKFSDFATEALSPIVSEMSKKSTDELVKTMNDIILLVADYEKKIKENYKFEFPDIAEGAYNANLEKLKAIGDLVNKRITKEAEEDEEAKKRRIKTIKEQYALEHELALNKIKADKSLTDEQREIKIAEEDAFYKARVYRFEQSEQEFLKMKELYGQLAISEEEKLQQAIIEIRTRYAELSLKQKAKEFNKLQSQQKRSDNMEIELLKVQLDTMKKTLNETPKKEDNKRRGIMDDILGAEFNIQVKEAEYEIERLSNKINWFKNQVASGLAAGGNETVIMEALGITQEEMDEMEDTLVIMLKRLPLIVRENLPPKETTIADLLGIDEKDWEILKMAIDSVTDSITGAVDAAVNAAQERVQASNDAIAELQRDLETEIALAEQGFASNVSLKRKQLEEEKKIRDQALKDQAEAQKKQLALQTVLDAANITSTIIRIGLSNASKGIIGLAITAIAAAGLFALISNVKAKSKAITKYKDGGWELLKGRSHEGGGISLGDNREAEGGEMLSVFNKRATKKYGKKISEFTDLVNKGKLDINTTNVLTASKANSPIVVNVDNKKLNDIHSVLKEINGNTVYYTEQYKIVKQGNRIRRIKRNGI